MSETIAGMLETIRAQIHDAEYAAVTAKARYEALLQVEEMLKQQEPVRRRQPRASANVTVVNKGPMPWDDEDEERIPAA